MKVSRRDKGGGKSKETKETLSGLQRVQGVD